MRWRMLSALLLTALIAVAACGGDEDVFGPGLEIEPIAGVYDVTRLTFDVSGSLGEEDILARMDDAIPPQIVVSLNGTVQLVYMDPETGRFEAPEGTVAALQGGGIRITFDTAEGPRRLLLPRRLDFTFDQTDGTLSFTGDVDAPLSRLIQLVPEFAEEQLRDPVRGRLDVELTRRTTQEPAA